MQTSRRKPDGPANTGTFGFYNIVWIVGALVGSAYLATVAFRPALVSRLADASDQLKTPGTTVVAKLDGIATRVESVTRSMEGLERDLSDLRQETSVQRGATAALSKRVSALEARFDKNDVKVSSGSIRNGGSPGRADRLARAPAGLVGSVVRDSGSVPIGKRVLLSRAEEGTLTTIPKVINKEVAPAAQIVTGSIALAPPPPPPNKKVKEARWASITKKVTVPTPQATTSADKKEYGLEIGRATTLEALREYWAKVSTKNATRLKGLSPLYRLVVGKKGDPLRLVAGPVTGKKKAHRLCTDLAVLGTRCIMTSYSGSPL